VSAVPRRLSGKVGLQHISDPTFIWASWIHLG
jgi:hypothetical protein